MGHPVVTKSWERAPSLIHDFRITDCSPDHAVDLVVEVGDGGEGHDSQHHEPDQHRVNVLGYCVLWCVTSEARTALKLPCPGP